MTLRDAVMCLFAAFTIASAANPIGLITKNIPRLNAQIEKLEPCPEERRSPIQFKNLVISQAGFNKYVLPISLAA